MDNTDYEIILKEKVLDKTIEENKQIDDAYYFFNYFPRYRNEGLVDENSENIISVKKRDQQAIKYFKHKIIDILNPNQEFVICIIPPSSTKAETSGISLIAKEICKVNSNWIDGTEIIKRIKTINQKHDKTKEYPAKRLEQESLEIINQDKIEDKCVLLLDDISTKGQAINISKEKLKNAGAKKVIVITLGKTKLQHNYVPILTNIIEETIPNSYSVEEKFEEKIPKITSSLKNPILINNISDLNNIRKGLDHHYKLNVDLDFNSINENSKREWKPIGTKKTPFSGSFNGNGHTISNLSINIPDKNNIGFFGYISNSSKIKNLGLENVKIIGKDYVGGLVGFSSGKISNCYITGEVTGVGYNVGGFAGFIYDGTITDCYSASLVVGNYSVGGFIGSSYTPKIENCYWDVNISKQEESAGGIGKSTIDMKTKKTFIDWDFSNIWDIKEGITYPNLIKSKN